MENVKIDDKEMEEAVKQAEEAENDYYFTHTFQKPFEYEGKKYESLNFAWDRLTGYDGLAIEREMQAIGTPVFVPSLSGDYLIRMAARANVEGIGIEDRKSVV